MGDKPIGKPPESSGDSRPPRPEDDFYLPDFCAPSMVLGVVLIAELVAIVLSLARGSPGFEFFADLAKTSLLMLWVGLAASAALCWGRPRLARMSVGGASAWAMALALGAVALVSEAVYWLGIFYPSVAGILLNLPGVPSLLCATGGVCEQPILVGTVPEWFPRNHGRFLAANLGIAGVVTALALRYYYVSNEWRRTVKRQAESRIHALQARIRPHFLFNSMNTIAALTRANPEAAEQAVEDLADLFRASLGDSGRLVSLDEELEIARTYERIENQRLGDRLNVEWDLEELPGDIGIPALTLQPLIENAIYHGIEPRTEGGPVNIRARNSAGKLNITITNPAPDQSKNQRPGNRMALDNIRERLELCFGKEASMETFVDKELYQVRMSLPSQSSQS